MQELYSIMYVSGYRANRVYEVLGWGTRLPEASTDAHGAELFGCQQSIGTLGL